MRRALWQWAALTVAFTPVFSLGVILPFHLSLYAPAMQGLTLLSIGVLCCLLLLGLVQQLLTGERCGVVWLTFVAAAGSAVMLLNDHDWSGSPLRTIALAVLSVVVLAAVPYAVERRRRLKVVGVLAVLIVVHASLLIALPSQWFVYYISEVAHSISPNDDVWLFRSLSENLAPATAAAAAALAVIGAQVRTRFRRAWMEPLAMSNNRVQQTGQAGNLEARRAARS